MATIDGRPAQYGITLKQLREVRVLILPGSPVPVAVSRNQLTHLIPCSYYLVAHGASRSRGHHQDPGSWRSDGNLQEAVHGSERGSEWQQSGHGAPARDVRLERDPTEAAQDVPDSRLGGVAGRDSDHLGGGRSRLLGIVFLPARGRRST